MEETFQDVDYEKKDEIFEFPPSKWDQREESLGIFARVKCQPGGGVLNEFESVFEVVLDLE